MEVRKENGEHDAVPAFSMLDLIEHDDAVDYISLNNGVRFYVEINEKDLQGEGGLVDVFNDFLDDLQDPENMFQFEEWLLQPLEDIMEELSPTPEPGSTRKPVTLLQYFCPPTFAFKLVNKSGMLCALQEEYNHEIHKDTSPRTHIIDSLPENHSTPEDTTVILRSSLPPVPLISGSELVRVDDGLSDEALSDVPTKVRRVSTDELFFFKGGFKDHGHQREMEILHQISQSGKFDPPFRTSRLVGLVTWEKGEGSDISLMGFLLEHINGKTLQALKEEASVATRRKWMAQIDATVKRLHELDIVWGDVKPDNVMINSSGDAVIIDFGGGYTPAYIPRELQQTKKGDVMGLDHMRAAMGITPPA
ncbi:hypothetical protein G7046_g7654 [Stylonectria norvegica]|nr:hypothetical protein G7046_g7654 [Stylonectria norvegica]